MDKKYEETYHQIEEWNWWFVSRRKIILKLLKGTEKKSTILDIGCAGGALLKDLKNEGYKNICGADFSAEAVTKCAQRNIKAYQMDAHNLTFNPNSFDILIASDCLEHLQFDETALKNWFDILKPNGKMLVFVPAYMFLWSEHDAVNHHYRRYTKTELKNKLEEAGFKVLRSGYWNFMLFFPTAIFRVLQQVKNKFIPAKTSPKNQLDNFNSVTNKLLIRWLSLENTVFRKATFPFGVSVFAEITKPMK